MKRIVTIVALGALALAQDQKPADLTDSERLAVMQSVVKLRGYEIQRKQMIEAAEKQIRDYRDGVLKQLDSAMEKLKTDAEAEAKSLDEQLAAKATKGWRINPDKGGVWEQVEVPDPPPAEGQQQRSVKK